MQDWWTDERVESVVTTRFIASHLEPEAQRRLNDVVFEELSNDTYLDWILSRARRLFLILVDSACVGNIFSLIEQSWEDSSLPIPEHDVVALRLPPRSGSDVNRLFFRNQFKYLIRTIREGEHIRYSSSASVPLHVVDQKVPNGYTSALDRVRLPAPNNKVFLRVREPMTGDQSEASVLSEITAIKSARHEHIASVFGSYSQGGNMYILTLPAAQYSLKSFLNDPPKTFKNMPKPERQMQLLLWPHCLSNAVAWIHANGFAHGAISPSRILVDEGFNVILGHFKDVRTAGPPSASKDIEYYQYAAPELCQRRLVVQKSGAAMPPTLDTLSEYQDLKDSISTVARSMTTSSSRGPSRPDSRMDSPIDTHPNKSLMRSEIQSISSSSTFSSGSSSGSISNGLTGSSGSSSSRRTRIPPSDFRHQILPEARTAVVQTFKSTSTDIQAADIFSLSAVTLDILTVLCSSSPASFAKHRAAASSRASSRGAAAVDSSFHANLVQVGGWASGLAKEAEKKVRKDGRKNKLFEAVGPNLAVVLQCLDRMPGRRLRGEMLSLTLEANLRDFAGVREGHCTLRTREGWGSDAGSVMGGSFV
ncbi:hypothetical protein B9Z65_4940 [Elsinoe australis]|uniref:Protein kinase domain-containing protein n=1 Tax=Elsinoe australis TaxID=40998 RepID=A0A2P8A6G8_9PEZI|nr:hypothetical protein B9Z65_4940 [Elsinoe australis]